MIKTILIIYKFIYATELYESYLKGSCTLHLTNRALYILRKCTVVQIIIVVIKIFQNLRTFPDFLEFSGFIVESVRLNVMHCLSKFHYPTHLSSFCSRLFSILYCILPICLSFMLFLQYPVVFA